MARVLHLRNFSVYVLDERGAPHHLPHAHIKDRGRFVGSVFLLSLEVFNEVERIPADLIELVAVEQEALLEKWMELNGDD